MKVHQILEDLKAWLRAEYVASEATFHPYAAVLRKIDELEMEHE